MKEQLIQYVNLLFAGARDCEDVKQEILQNTLDRYDDLIAEGKVPEAAYRLAITGIGDIHEILGNAAPASGYHPPSATPAQPRQEDTPLKKGLRAAAIFLYIICPTPLFMLSEYGNDTLGLCCTLLIVAIATVLLILGGKKGQDAQPSPAKKESELQKSIRNLISAIGVAAYFIISFATNAWYITWILFPIVGAVQGLVKAILDLKEAMNHEK